MSSFRDMLSSYFDEITSIVDEQKKQKEEGMNAQEDGRPYSSMLTQDEEPTDMPDPNATEEPEPEVQVRGV